MVRTVYRVAVSLDGYIADFHGSLPGLLSSAGPAGREQAGGGPLERVGALVMGAETYRLLQAPGAPAWAFGTIPAWVFTHHEFAGVEGANITFVRGDVAEFHPDLTADAGAKDLWLLGGGDLAGQFMDRGLVDELILTLVPVILGGGRPLLRAGTTAVPAVLAGARALEDGLVELRYSFR